METLHAESPTTLPADLLVVRTPEAARSLLDPLRRAILAELATPGSSSSVADSLDLPRQRVNYHVRELERDGLVTHVEDRRRGNCVERIVRGTAMRYLLAPELATLLPPEDPTPSRGSPAEGHPPERPHSPEALLDSAARTLSEVAILRDEARRQGTPLPTLSLEHTVQFRSPREEAEFAQVAARVLARLVQRYHAPRGADGGCYRVTLGGYPDPGATGAGR